MLSLSALGWTPRRADAFAPYAARGLVPGRVGVAYGATYRVFLDGAETLADVGLSEKVHEELGGAPQPMSAKMPSMIGPGVWIASALPIDGVIRELALPAM